MKTWKLTYITILFLIAPSVNAALIDNGIITTDTRTGLEWLDLTETVGMSYEYVSSQFGTGGLFEGWTYATTFQIEDLFDSAGGTRPYDGWSTANNGIVTPLINLWGSTAPDYLGVTEALFLTSDSYDSNNHWIGTALDWTYSDVPPVHETMDYLNAQSSILPNNYADTAIGSALVRPAVVPVPAAGWLFLTGLISLIGIAHRKRTHN